MSTNRVSTGTHALAVVAVACLLATLSAAAAATRSLPVTPQTALSLLPDAPPGLDRLGPWKLTMSRARQQIAVDWLTTTAERRFEQAAPLPDITPAKVSLRTLDTGMYELPLHMFGPEPITNPRRDLEVQSFPAFKRNIAPGSERMMILVAGRWLVDVMAEGLSPGDFSALLRALPLARLAAVEMKPADNLPPTVSLSVIDELNPAANSTRLAAFLSQADRLAAEEKYGRFLEAPREPAGHRGSTEEPGR